MNGGYVPTTGEIEAMWTANGGSPEPFWRWLDKIRLERDEDVARAWDEGYQVAYAKADEIGPADDPNPYRSEPPDKISEHALTTDGLCNYRCAGCDWTYAHVGWGDPDMVAQFVFRSDHKERKK